MSQPDLFERRLPEGLTELAGAHVPSYLDDILAESRRTRQRPRWSFIERWLPMTTITRPVPIRRPLPATWLLLAVGALLAVLLAGTLLGAATLLRSDSAVLPAPPVGPARNGLLAFDHPSGDIWVVDPDGSDPRPFVTGPTIDVDPVWSPDGTKLAYWALAAPGSPKDRYQTSDFETARASRTAALVVVDADGASPRVIVDGIRLDFGAMPPAWSPEGDALVFSHTPGEDPFEIAIDLVRLDEQGTTRIVEHGRSPTWSPDGSSIAYSGAEGDGTDGVYVLQLESGDTARVSSVSGTFTGFAFQLPQWSPDSRLLTYFAGPGTFDIWVAETDGGGDRVIAETSGDPATDSLDVWPAWSPDGSRIAYFGRYDSPSLYATVRPDGSDPVSLPGELSAMSPPTTWSPDGTRLVAFRQNGGEMRLLDTSGAHDPVSVDVTTLWQSNSWQRLAP